MERFYTVQTFGSVYEYGNDISMDSEGEITFNIDHVTFFNVVDEAPEYSEVFFGIRMFIMETSVIDAITSSHGLEIPMPEDWDVIGN